MYGICCRREVGLGKPWVVDGRICTRGRANDPRPDEGEANGGPRRSCIESDTLLKVYVDWPEDTLDLRSLSRCECATVCPSEDDAESARESCLECVGDLVSCESKLHRKSSAGWLGAFANIEGGSGGGVSASASILESNSAGGRMCCANCGDFVVDTAREGGDLGEGIVTSESVLSSLLDGPASCVLVDRTCAG